MTTDFMPMGPAPGASPLLEGKRKRSEDFMPEAGYDMVVREYCSCLAYAFSGGGIFEIDIGVDVHRLRQSDLVHITSSRLFIHGSWSMKSIVNLGSLSQ